MDHDNILERLEKNQLTLEDLKSVVATLLCIIVCEIPPNLVILETNYKIYLIVRVS